MAKVKIGAQARRGILGRLVTQVRIAVQVVFQKVSQAPVSGGCATLRSDGSRRLWELGKEWMLDSDAWDGPQVL